MKMNEFALVVYVVIALLAKILGLAFTVSVVLWLLGLFNIAGNTVLGLFVSSFALAVIATGLMEMIKKGAL
ncbi:MAG: hypothetical protein E7I21_10775 [Limosilactobacillus fermentum]|jgi:hypothetical protein|nr:hypothetical protein [Limosilactobacillus fermentum]